MKAVFASLFLILAVGAIAQGHDITPPEALKKIDFMLGQWVGKQDFNNPGGEAMVGDASNHVQEVIGGRYLEERLSTTMTGRRPTDTRHFISYDPKTRTYKAWWFNDTAVTPSEFEGTVDGKKLVLTSKANANGNVLRASYDGSDAGKLVYMLEMKQGDSWLRLFTTTYKKKA